MFLGSERHDTSKWIFENRFVTIYPKNTCDSRAPRGLVVAPRPSHTTAPRFASERTAADERLGERGLRGRVSSLPGVVDNRKYMEIPVSLQLGLYHHQRISYLYSAVSWVGRLVRRWVVGSGVTNMSSECPSSAIQST